MKKIIKIKTSLNNYDILIENNSILKNIISMQQDHKKIFIIIDNNLKQIINKINEYENLNIIKIKGGEKIKTNLYYSKICNQLLKGKIDRASCIIAIGGGTIGDLAGFVASTILRGVKLILIPTTLLAQVDSSIGGKNGINSIYGKNLIGTFYQPNKVIIDPYILKTLTKKEIKSGYAEILKHSLIKNANFYLWLKKYSSKVINLESKYVCKAIIESIKIKSFFVMKDEKENLINNKSRAMLNFGHTFGHALEAMNNYNKKLTHGEAISIGMAFAAKISCKKNLISKDEYNELINHLKKIKLPYFDKRIKEKEIYNIMEGDKKNNDGEINLILLKKIGEACFQRAIKKEEIKRLLN